MKQLSTLLLIFFISLVTINAQTSGTIKVAKPVKKDSVITSPSKRIYLQTFAGANYTFKKNNQIGWNARLTFIPNNYHPCNYGIGIEYSIQYQYFQLSSYNTKTKSADTPYPRSQNKGEYIKIPLDIMYHILYGSRGNTVVFIEATPGYLFKDKDEHNRLNISDFNQFNLSGTFGLGFRLRGSLGIYLSYSRSFISELKDKNLYDITGQAIGSQRSKTRLLSLSILYGIPLWKK
ncbi:MAG: hypothetical protein ACXVPU_13140 [Bacteroidia bacterium]